MLKKRKKVFVLLLFVVIASIVTMTLTYSKYVYNNVWNYYLKSKDFYFSSDSLSYNGKKNTDLKWDGNFVSFNINNYLNSEFITDYDIEYKITCSVEDEAKEYAKCVINNTDSSIYNGVLTSNKKCINNTTDGVNVSSYNKVDCNLNGYTWKIEPTSKDLSFNVVLLDDKKSLDDVSVKIEAESTSPYKQKLTGYYQLHKQLIVEEQIMYEYSNYTNYDELTIYNPLDDKKCLSINWDSEILRIDAQLGEFLEYKTKGNYIIEIKIDLDSNSTKKIKFYKFNLENNYSLDNFIINESNCE